MDDYRDYVNAVAQIADGKEIIQNKTPAHAGVLLAALFGKAKREVLIVSGTLDGRAYGTAEVLAAADKFLSSPDAQLKIVVETAVTFDGCEFLAHLQRAGALGDGRVTIHRFTGKAPFHFLLADEMHYRFEADPSKHEAIAQFGANGVELRNAFNTIWNASAEYTPA